jgi:hypothetical protein
MTIDQVNVVDVAVFKAEDDPPVCRHAHGPEALRVSAEAMPPEAGKVHLADIIGLIEACKNTRDLFDLIGARTSAIVRVIKPLQSAMAEPLNHERL